MNRLSKSLKTVYRIGNKIFNSKDDAILYLQKSPSHSHKDLETITLSRVSHEFGIRPTSNARTIMTVESCKGNGVYYLSYSTDSPPYDLDLTLGVLEGEQKKEKSVEVPPLTDFILWRALIDELFNKGYHVRDGISPFQLYEHDSKFFASIQALVTYRDQKNSDFNDYRTINIYPDAFGDGKEIVVVEDIYADNRADGIHFIRTDIESGQYQYFNYLYPLSNLNNEYTTKLAQTEFAWENCVELSSKCGKSFGGTSWVFNKSVAESIFKAIKNHHALVTVTPVTPGSNHLFLYDGKFYTNFNDVFNRCKKDNRFLNDSVRVYEYSGEVSKTGAIKTYMYGDNAAECFAYCDENSYSRLGINEDGNISSKEILDTSLDQIQQVFYYYMTKGLTPEDTTSRINKYFGERNHRQKLSPLEKVLKPQSSIVK